MKQRAQLVLFNHCVGKHPDGNAHVLIAFHGRAEVKILEIFGQKLCIWSGIDAVDQEFGGGQIGSFGADFEGAVSFVATNCPVHSMGFCFLGAERRHHTEVCGFVALRHG